jgi:hypothetical protein
MKRCLSVLLSLTGVLLLVAAVSACKPEARSNQAPQPTIVPSTLPSSTAVATISIASNKPVQCQFNGIISNPNSQTSTPDEKTYTLSGPTVVLTSPTPLSVEGWLPNNRDLLTIRTISGTVQGSVEVLNTATGQTQVYAVIDDPYKAFWLPQQQAVAFHATRIVNRFTVHDLWISRGSPNQMEKVVEDLPTSFQVDKANSRLLIFSGADNQAQITPKASGLLQSTILHVNPNELKYPKYSVTTETVSSPSIFSAVLNSDGTKAALYDSPWLLLLDTSTNQVCEVDLGATAKIANGVTRASWSPDGRYLALTIIRQPPGMLIRSSWLRILDTATGQSLTPDLGVPFAWESFWLPDNRHVIVFGQTATPPMDRATDKLFLVDVVRQKATPLQTNLEIGGGHIGSLMALSPDGHTLAITCTLFDTNNRPLEYRICSFRVGEAPVQ